MHVRRPVIWWLSFARTGGEFLGGLFAKVDVRGSDAQVLGAILHECWQRRVNPGGEVRAAKLVPDFELPEGWETWKLYSKAEIEALGGARRWE